MTVGSVRSYPLLSCIFSPSLYSEVKRIILTIGLRLCLRIWLFCLHVIEERAQTILRSSWLHLSHTWHCSSTWHHSRLIELRNTTWCSWLLHLLLRRHSHAWLPNPLRLLHHHVHLHHHLLHLLLHLHHLLWILRLSGSHAAALQIHLLHACLHHLHLLLHVLHRVHVVLGCHRHTTCTWCHWVIHHSACTWHSTCHVGLRLLLRRFVLTHKIIERIVHVKVLVAYRIRLESAGNWICRLRLDWRHWLGYRHVKYTS